MRKPGPNHADLYLPELDETGWLRQRRNVVLGLLTLVSVLNFVDRMLLPALIQPIKGEFSLSDTRVGLLTGFVFALCYAAAGLPIARAADTHSRRNIVALSVAVWSALTSACGLAQSYWQLLLGRMGVGCAESGSIPASYSLLSDYFPPERRTFATGILAGGNALGITLGLALGGWLGTLFGWRRAFLIVGAPGALLGLAVRLVVREPLRPHLTTCRASLKELIRSLGMNAAYLWVVAGCVMSSFINYGTAQWLPTFFVRTHHFSLAAAGGLIGLAYGLGMLTGSIAGGFLGDRMSRDGVWRPQLLCIWSALFVLPLHSLVLWLPRPGLASVATFAATAVNSLQSPAMLAGLLNVTDSGNRATASAISIMMNSLLGIGLAPLVIGMLSDGFTAAGSDALRYAMTAMLPLDLVAAWVFFQMMNATRRQFESHKAK